MTVSLRERTGSVKESVDGTKNVYRVKIIEAGPGSSTYYPAEVIERDGPSAFPGGLDLKYATKAYADHPTMDEQWTQPERSVMKIVGKQVSAAEWDAETQALWADYKFSEKFSREVVDEFMNVIGMSIYALGENIQDENGYDKIATIGEYTGTVLSRFIPDILNSVDVVTAAGAGGEIKERLTEAMKPFVERGTAEPQRSETINKENNSMDIAELATRVDKLQESIETLKSVVTQVAESVKPAVVDPETPDIAAVAEAVATSELPEVGRKRVYEAVKAGAKVEDAVSAEKAYAKQIEESVQARLTKESNEVWGSRGDTGATFELRGFGGSK